MTNTEILLIANITRPNCAFFWVTSGFRNKDAPFVLNLFFIFFDRSGKLLTSRVDQKCLSYNFHIRKKAYPTFSYIFLPEGWLSVIDIALQMIWIVKVITSQMIKWKHQTFKFWQNFSNLIFFLNWIFKLSKIDQGIYKHAIQQKTRDFSLFKKVILRNEKKNPIFVHRGLRYANKKLKVCMQIFFWKMFVWVQNSIWGWKKNKKKFWGNFNFTWVFI